MNRRTLAALERADGRTPLHYARPSVPSRGVKLNVGSTCGTWRDALEARKADGAVRRWFPPLQIHVLPKAGAVPMGELDPRNIHDYLMLPLRFFC